MRSHCRVSASRKALPYTPVGAEHKGNKGAEQVRHKRAAYSAGPEVSGDQIK
jgi:hypothetical protein